MQPQPSPAPAIVALSDGLMRSVIGTVTDAGPVRRELDENAGEAESAAPTQRLDVAVSSIEVVTDDEDVQAAMSGGVRLTVRWLAGESAAGAAEREPVGAGAFSRRDHCDLPLQSRHDHHFAGVLRSGDRGAYGWASCMIFNGQGSRAMPGRSAR